MKSSETFWPPKPKEFEIAARCEASRAVVTMSRELDLAGTLTIRDA